MKTALCVAGKSRAAVDVLEAATKLNWARPLCLPNAGDTGQDGWQPSLRSCADRLGVPLISLDQAMAEPDLCFLSVEYDRIVRPKLFASSALFNIHLSLLPKFRGCNTAVWPILQGEVTHGVTLHEIDAGVDTGPIIARRAFPIGPESTARDLYFRCLELGAELAIEFLPKLLSEDYLAIPQSNHGASTYRRSDLDYSQKEIDPRETTEMVMRRIRAFNFPEYQRATFRGVDILAAFPNDAEGGGLRVETADGFVRLILAG